jgi:hypothetical protein
MKIYLIFSMLNKEKCKLYELSSDLHKIYIDSLYACGATKTRQTIVMPATNIFNISRSERVLGL